MKIYSSVWGSVVNFANEVIGDMQYRYPDIGIEFIDWESHANILELPTKDLIGPMSLTLMETSPQFFEVSFTIAVSTYSDENLFRHRDYVGETFERMRPQKQIKVYDSETAAELGFLIMTEGTLLAPMSRADVRPFQYVQASALLEPTLT